MVSSRDHYRRLQWKTRVNQAPKPQSMRMINNAFQQNILLYQAYTRYVGYHPEQGVVLPSEFRRARELCLLSDDGELKQGGPTSQAKSEVQAVGRKRRKVELGDNSPICEPLWPVWTLQACHVRPGSFSLLILMDSLIYLVAVFPFSTSSCRFRLYLRKNSRSY